MDCVFSNGSCESTLKWETCQIFKEDKTVGERLAGASVTKKVTLLAVSRTAVSRVMTAYKEDFIS